MVTRDQFKKNLKLSQKLRKSQRSKRRMLPKQEMLPLKLKIPQLMRKLLFRPNRKRWLKERRLKLSFKKTKIPLRQSKMKLRTKQPQLMLPPRLLKKLILNKLISQQNQNLMLIRLRLNRVYISQSQVSITTQKAVLLLLTTLRKQI